MKYIFNLSRNKEILFILLKKITLLTNITSEKNNILV